MRKFVTAAAIAAIVAPGVAQAAPKAAKPALIAVVDHTEKCAVATQKGADEALPGAILSLVLGTVVDAGIKGLGKAMTKAGADKEVHVKDSLATYFYTGELGAEPKLKRKATCLRVVAGPKGGDGLPVGTASPQNADLGDAATWVKESGFDRAPALYMETRMRLSDDRTAFQLVPVKAFIGKPLQGKAERDLVVTFSIVAPSVNDDGDVLATRGFALKRPTEGAMDTTVLEAMASDWIPLPTPTDAAKGRFEIAVQRQNDIADLEKVLAELNAPPKPVTTKPGTKPAAKPPEDPPKKADVEKRLGELKTAAKGDPAALASLMPVTLRVDVHETADGNKLLAAIGGFLTDNADKISEPILEEIDPAKRKAAAKTAATEAQSLRIAAIEAVEAWQTTDAGAESTEAQKRVKKLQAEGACRALRDAKLDDVACLGL